MAERTFVQTHRHPDRRNLANLSTQNRFLTGDEGAEGIGDVAAESLLFHCNGLPEEGLELGQGCLDGVDVVRIGREK
jgi:hypothetical protein